MKLEGKKSKMNTKRFSHLLALLFLFGSCAHHEKKDSLRTLASDQLTNEKIQAAMRAENLAPTLQVSIRESGAITQYTALDRPEMVGKKILVNFIQDRERPGANASTYPVPQLVLTKEFLDPASKDLVATIQRESVSGNQKFQEVGGWIIYTNRGAYRSDTFTSNDPYILQNGIVLSGLEQVFERARQAEGFGVKIIDVEFYHTHLERGEAFSFGDLSFQEKYYQKTIKKNIEYGGSYAAYAIPIQGEVIFRNVIRKNP